jgi:hypothetical protein
VGNRPVDDVELGALPLEAVDEPRRLLVDGVGPVE